MSIGDTHPTVGPTATTLIDAWVEQCLTTLLTEFGRALTGVMARHEYDD